MDVFGAEKISRIEDLLEEGLAENSITDIYDLEAEEGPEDLTLRIHAYSAASEADYPYFFLGTFEDAYAVFEEIFGEGGVSDEFSLEEHSLDLSIEYAPNRVYQIEKLNPDQIEKVQASNDREQRFRELYEEVI